jgi:hypothetical protein
VTAWGAASRSFYRAGKSANSPNLPFDGFRRQRTPMPVPHIESHSPERLAEFCDSAKRPRLVDRRQLVQRSFFANCGSIGCTAW